jgi:hypothetical protein
MRVAVREPSATHTITLQQIERWLGTTGTPPETMKKAKLKQLLVRRA